MVTLLEVKNLSTTLFLQGVPLRVVDNLSFSLEKGKTLALVGESGSGKTLAALSLLKLVAPELHPLIEGEVFFEGKDLLSLSSHALRDIRGKEAAFIFQNPKRALNPVFSIGEQLREVFLYRSDLDDEEIEKRVVEALDRVGIPSAKERLASFPHELSGGMIQRVMIALALLLKPKLLIADEPTTALDVTTQASILKLLKELQTEEGMALLLITHDMGVVAEMADDVFVLYATQGIETGKVDQLFRDPHHPYTQALFKARFIDGKIPEPIPGNVPSPKRLPKGCHFSPRCPNRFYPCDQEVPLFQMGERLVRCWLYDANVDRTRS
jgi:oligopeptide/dipeptide ABC transporter ATP-binding protein